MLIINILFQYKSFFQKKTSNLQTPWGAFLVQNVMLINNRKKTWVWNSTETKLLTLTSVIPLHWQSTITVHLDCNWKHGFTAGFLSSIFASKTIKKNRPSYLFSLWVKSHIVKNVLKRMLAIQIFIGILKFRKCTYLASMTIGLSMFYL